MPRFGKRPATEVTRHDVIKMIDEIVGRPTAQAHGAFAMVRGIWTGPSTATWSRPRPRIGSGRPN